MIVEGSLATGEPLPASQDDYTGSIWSVLAAQDGEAEFHRKGNQGMIRISFPLARRISVLVIDDNEDVVHVFRRYTTGTHYQVQRLARPSADVLQQIVEVQPDIVVLDVLMPEVDGWEMLANLRQHPATHHIPVIVCSVIRQGELAQALGADGASIQAREEPTVS